MFTASEFHRNREEQSARDSWSNVRVDGDVLVWTSNGQHPMSDMVAVWLRLGLITERQAEATSTAREAATEVFFASYRAAQARRTPAELAEERAEMLAAFGPGETVVDVITGRRVVL